MLTQTQDSRSDPDLNGTEKISEVRRTKGSSGTPGQDCWDQSEHSSVLTCSKHEAYFSQEWAAQCASSSSTSTAQPKGRRGGGTGANTGTQLAMLYAIREHSLCTTDLTDFGSDPHAEVSASLHHSYLAPCCPSLPRAFLQAGWDQTELQRWRGQVHFCTPNAGLHTVSPGQSCRGLPGEKGKAEPSSPATVAPSQHFPKPQLERTE